ncbi:pentapeptide repeat-containing protein [Frankia sp. R82]|uniref:pentapeptide repeat-containing protein n=1 Tax=Frankia sp. R82 TaxID=2950553 RepID=UPI002043D29B|nr:pentapeptide repeat-containing protein [Frankia sp. R82]MCM3886566.1 pentapeptide repeat-containing protein [Frankia sp. R82]
MTDGEAGQPDRRAWPRRERHSELRGDRPDERFRAVFSRTAGLVPRRTAMLLGGALGGTAAVAAAVWVPTLLYGEPGEPRATLQAALLAIIAAALVAGALALVAAQVRTASERAQRVATTRHSSGRYTSAVGQLAAEAVEVRLGGIYALGRLARESPTDQVTVVEVLSAFARARSTDTARRASSAAQRGPLGEVTPAADIRAAVQVLAGLPQRDGVLRADLRHADLTGPATLRELGLARADLRRVRLDQADLTGADLTFADLRGVELTFVILTGADLTGADLADARLSGVTLRGARLSGANLRGARLIGTDLTEARLIGAQLTGADLPGVALAGARLLGADLTDARMIGAELADADLVGANLTGATLTKAHCRGADLTGAELTGADLTGADLTGVRSLTQDQVDSALGGLRTLLPAGLRRPAAWEPHPMDDEPPAPPPP